MNPRNKLLGIICLTTLILTNWTYKSTAQLNSSGMKPAQFFSPFIKIVSEALLGDNSTISKVNFNSDNNTGYLNSSLFFFDENIRFCKDIFAPQQDSIQQQNNSSSKPNTAKDSIRMKTEPKRENEQKKSKSFWNHPGNTKSRI